ncbi:RING-H2 finger protein ATL33 isoform X1 [Arachis duranensis]|uniref:RING-H2 finger protein ATL33 isoform X1 n=1 Tax=Arachis duranensis TaxID=130453 RepID=A0A9C6WK53_ARADU|nr:RING-H2 finger protein ATL33 isoform X1 [Arachis duranensis]
MDKRTTTTITHTPSPSLSPPPPSSQLVFYAPPLSPAQIAILNTPPPPFPGGSSSFDLSPLEFLLAIVAMVTLPAVIYTFIFAYGCPSCRRQPERNSGEHSSESRDGDSVIATAVAEFRYQKDSHVKEIGGECPVCLSAFADGEKLRQLSDCKHSFHADCINLWLSNHTNCPICRSIVAGAGRKRPSSSAPARDHHDFHQGLPDASGLFVAQGVNIFNNYIYLPAIIPTLDSL